jgi:hypothetical protein
MADLNNDTIVLAPDRLTGRQGKEGTLATGHWIG